MMNGLIPRRPIVLMNIKSRLFVISRATRIAPHTPPRHAEHY
jgi:hypothetical protein